MEDLSDKVKIGLLSHPEPDSAIILLDANTTQIGRVPYLTYAAFTIMGALGHLSETPTGPPVPNFHELQVFFVPDSETYSVVDRFETVPTGFSLPRTSRTQFFCGLEQRDGQCLAAGGLCAGRHLVALAAGSDYIAKMTESRPGWRGAFGGHHRCPERYPAECKRTSIPGTITVPAANPQSLPHSCTYPTDSEIFGSPHSRLAHKCPIYVSWEPPPTFLGRSPRTIVPLLLF
ncbi:hypothetical protein B0H10DRAFT_1112241 [Mycena sp. CBHHK59/15]|nr:hypothetical protein B0H10DRAFT_1112241 [Mycena sp. CBHHK59/15]